MAPALAGCVGGGDDPPDRDAADGAGEVPTLPKGLEMEGSEVVSYNATSVTWRLDATLSSGAFLPTGPVGDVVEAAFEVPGDLQFFLTANLTWDASRETELFLAVRDPAGDAVCTSSTYARLVPQPAYEECGAAVEASTGPSWWTVAVEPRIANPRIDVPITLHVTLWVPTWHLLEAPAPVVHTPEGRALPTSAWAGEVPSFAAHELPTTAYEPTLGVTPDGVGFYATAAEGLEPGVFRSEDRGITWTDVSPHIAGQRTDTSTMDPFVHVDPVTGRVFNVDLEDTVTCARVSFSDDLGESWTTTPLGCGSTPVDHMNLWTGPAPGTTVGYPRIVYLCYNDFQGGLWCTRSLDGGHTFGPASLLAVEDGGNVFTNPTAPRGYVELGHGASAPGGTAYVPRVSCDTLLIHVSRDGGVTWKEHVVDDTLGVIQDNIDEDEATLAVDAAGNLYYYWLAADGLPRLTISPDEGVSWSDPVSVAAPGITAARFPSITSGQEGRVAFLYYGTNDPNDGRWDAYIGMTQDALADEPVFATVAANDHVDPLHVGRCIGRCGGLGDFMDLEIDPTTGAVWAALVDGCTPARCMPHGHPLASSPLSPALAAVQAGGPTLLEGSP